jgi:TyrR family helix-turn-helix protein/PAS domain S-box-containing protein
VEDLNNYKVLKEELKQYEQLYNEIKIASELTFDQITVLDGNAKILCVGKACQSSFGMSEEEVIGKYAKELEKKGMIDKSITLEVLKRKEKVTLVQHTGGNKILMATGFPMFNEKNEIVKVINISKDITSIEKLRKQIQNTGEIVEWFEEEISKRKIIEKEEIVSKNCEMQKIIDLIKRTADLDSTVLLLGETGIGKGFLANIIHKVSNRKDKPFVTINCGAIPENLLESELFGYVEGAFTGASKKGKKGLFEIAKDGIIFLDEIGDMPMQLQVKLLNVLQERRASRVGDVSPYKIKAKIIAATNKDLKKAVKNGEFREDLYYRLNVLPMYIPPLRDRIEDIPVLINHMINKCNSKYGMGKKLSKDGYNMLLSHDWPGNIRELENVIERLVITCNEDMIDKEQVSDVINPKNNRKERTFEINEIIPLKEATKKLEKQMLMSAKQSYKTTRKMAKVLKIDQSTVVRKLKEYHID